MAEFRRFSRVLRLCTVMLGLFMFPAFGVEELACSPGYYADFNTGTCEGCPAGSWCPGGVLRVAEADSNEYAGLNSCGTNKFSRKLSRDESACKPCPTTNHGTGIFEDYTEADPNYGIPEHEVCGCESGYEWHYGLGRCVVACPGTADWSYSFSPDGDTSNRDGVLASFGTMALGDSVEDCAAVWAVINDRLWCGDDFNPHGDSHVKTLFGFSIDQGYEEEVINKGLGVMLCKDDGSHTYLSSCTEIVPACDVADYGILQAAYRDGILTDIVGTSFSTARKVTVHTLQVTNYNSTPPTTSTVKTTTMANNWIADRCPVKSPTGVVSCPGADGTTNAYVSSPTVGEFVAVPAEAFIDFDNDGLDESDCVAGYYLGSGFADPTLHWQEFGGNGFTLSQVLLALLTGQMYQQTGYNAITETQSDGHYDQTKNLNSDAYGDMVLCRYNPTTHKYDRNCTEPLLFCGADDIEFVPGFQNLMTTTSGLLGVAALSENLNVDITDNGWKKNLFGKKSLSELTIPEPANNMCWRKCGNGFAYNPATGMCEYDPTVVYPNSIEYHNVPNGVTNNNPLSYTADELLVAPITLTDLSRDGFSFDGWCLDEISGDDVSCPAGKIITQITQDLGDIDLYATWSTSTISITYRDPEDDSVIYQTTTAEGGTEKQLPTKNGYIFTGWCKSTNYNTTTGACSSIVGPQTTGNKTVVRWVIPNDVAVDTTYYALYQEDKFQIHTTKINTVPSGTAASAATDYYAFGLTASGKYYVDWGDGVVEIINRSDTTPRTYSHTYSDADRTYTIHFGGFGSSYSNYSAARFCGNVNIDGRSGTLVSVNENVTINNTINQEKVESLTGSLGAIFSGSPNFNKTFGSCKNLTSIPDTLFGRVIKDANNHDVYQGVTGNVAGMFNETFLCSPKLASIPENLFGRVIKDANDNNVYRGVSGNASNMFRNTFESWGNGCWNLYITSIPGNLFGRVIKDANDNDVYVGVSGNAKWLFFGTFSGLDRLASIPENLFGRVVNGQYYGVSGAAEGMFGYTFRATGITKIPEKLFTRVIKDANDNDVYVGVSDAAESMFASTFAENSRLTSIPEDLFIGVTGKANYMFSSTFSSTNITSIPENLFGRVIDGQYRGVTDSANGMFASTFNRCRRFETIPEKLFGRVIDGQYYGVSGHAPSLFQNTFQACDKLRSIHENLFMGVSGSAASMFEGTFMNCPWLSSIPEKLFGRTVDGQYYGVSGAAERMFADTFNDCEGLRAIPETLFAGISGDINSATGMFDHTFSNAFDSGDDVEPDVYVPAGLFAGINLASYQSGPMNGIFENAPLLATDCGNMEEVSPNYLKVDWFKDGECTDINNPSCEFVVACVPLQAHTITYNTNGGTMSGDNITMVTENQKYTQEYNSAITLPSTTKQDFIFAGWCLDEISEDEIVCPADRRLSVITADNIDDITLYATWTAPKFEITTTSDTDSFQFKISAVGVFYVDWGDNTVERYVRTNDIITSTTYSHEYESAGSYTIKFGGGGVYDATDNPDGVTEYSTAGSAAAITFNVTNSYNNANVKKIAGISGSLGALFPTIGGAAATTGLAGDAPELLAIQPQFYRTFWSATNLTSSIPAELFGGVVGQPVQNMFLGTFANCSGLTGTNEQDPNNSGLNYAIPPTLFNGISGRPAASMFVDTFMQSGLTGSIPETLFSGISGAPVNLMFLRTFYGCGGLTGSIPENLFGGISGAPADWMFGSTFMQSGLTGSIPENLFIGISGAPAHGMFNQTFDGCGGLTGEIPENLFSGISGAPAGSMFSSTFSRCSGLTGPIPDHLFGNLSGAPAEYMFAYTFLGCTNLGTNSETGESAYYVPSTLFAGISDNPDDAVQSQMSELFSGTSLLTSCPIGTTEYETQFRRDWCTIPYNNCSEYTPGMTTEYAISCVPAVYDIKYNLDGGTNNSDNPDTYVMSDTAITLANPTKSGFAFAGWYDNADFDGDAVTEIPAGSYGDKEFWAKWEEVSTYVVYFDANATDADGTKGEQPCDYGEPCDITNNEITRMDYNFVGWVDASGTEYTDYTMTHTESLENDEITLYAMWEPICRSGKRLHIDDQSMCLYERKRTDIALAFWLDGKKYYLNMCNASECENSMTMGTNKKLHLLYGEDVYNVYDLTAE